MGLAMAWSTKEITNWEEMRKWIDEKTRQRATFLFRGQPNEKYSLEPRLTRLLNKGDLSSDDYGIAHQIELKALSDFLRTAPILLSEAPPHMLARMPSEPDLNWWALMQHYGAPTRLLDWTGSPYAALYFAIVSEPDQAGALWCYSQEHLESWLNRAVNEGELHSEPVLSLRWQDYRGRYKIFKKPVIHHFILQTWTTRMAAQQGVFTVCTDVFCNHKDLLDEIFTESGAKDYGLAIIPPKLKSEFLKQLHYMNITGATLYPGIDGVGRFVDERVRIAVSDTPQPLTASGISLAINPEMRTAFTTSSDLGWLQ
jgi:FRG domain